MELKAFTTSDTVTLGDPGMYGWAQVLIKKHVWPDENVVLRGALLHDADTGHNYFATEADLARYAEPAVQKEGSSDA